MADEESKIIIDSDWKEEAQQEKDRLAEEVGPDDRGAMPEASFMEVVQMLAMQAVIGLGGMQTPDGRTIPPDINVAKHHIDLLEILQTKTEGNLDETESAAVTAMLHDLRLSFVNVASGQPGMEEAPEEG
jgi:hypothetical protein